jgi:hypothetical protein
MVTIRYGRPLEQDEPTGQQRFDLRKHDVEDAGLEDVTARLDALVRSRRLLRSPRGSAGNFASCRREPPEGAKIPLSPADLEEDRMARKTEDAEIEHERKPRGKRRLAMLLAIAGGAFYLMRRNQRRAKIDEGVWHEAPSA